MDGIFLGMTKGDENVYVLGETYIFFADIYFIQNLMIKLGVLGLTIKVLKIQMTKPVMKIVAIASVGTILEIAGLFFIPNYQVFMALVHLIEVPGMMAFLFGKQREYIGKGIICGYFFVLVINGVVEVIWNLIGNGWFYPLLVLAGNVIVVVAICFGIRKWQMSKGVYPVDIHLPDVIWTAKGYYDSGNHLKDPYTGKSVHIISEKLAKRLELPMDKKVCIPYQSLGNEAGLIDVYYVEAIRIKKQADWVVQNNVPLAVAEDSLFTGKGYEMIINEEVW